MVQSRLDAVKRIYSSVVERSIADTLFVSIFTHQPAFNPLPSIHVACSLYHQFILSNMLRLRQSPNCY